MANRTVLNDVQNDFRVKFYNLHFTVTLLLRLMALPRTTAAPHQETEIITINSSPVEAWGGPNPRVIKRKNNRYMLPRSPISPSRNIMAPVSGSSIARFQNNYMNVNGEIFFSS